MKTFADDTKLYIVTKHYDYPELKEFTFDYADIKRVVKLRSGDEELIIDVLNQHELVFDAAQAELLEEFVTGYYDRKHAKLDVLKLLDEQNGFGVVLEDNIFGIGTTYDIAYQFVQELDTN